MGDLRAIRAIFTTTSLLVLRLVIGSVIVVQRIGDFLVYFVYLYFSPLRCQASVKEIIKCIKAVFGFGIPIIFFLQDLACQCDKIKINFNHPHIFAFYSYDFFFS